MSDFIYQDPESADCLNIVSYAGPARIDGGPRRRYQISKSFGTDFQCVTMSTEEWDRLAEWMKSR